MRSLILLLFMVGCGGGASGPASGLGGASGTGGAHGLGGSGVGGSGPATCTPRHGLYQATFTAQSGNCGAISPEVVNASDPDAGAGCTGTPTDLMSCMLTVDTVCPSANGQTVHTIGTATWATNGETGSAHVQLQVMDGLGVLVCSGIYAIVYARFQ